MAFIADHRRECKAAAQCGGIQPYPPRTIPNTGMPKVADAGNASYAEVVRSLVYQTRTSVSRAATEDQKIQVETLTLLNDEGLGWCCRAAFAAAYVAHAHDAGMEKSCATLEEGVWAEGDLPTWRSMGS